MYCPNIGEIYISIVLPFSEFRLALGTLQVLRLINKKYFEKNWLPSFTKCFLRLTIVFQVIVRDATPQTLATSFPGGSVHHKIHLLPEGFPLNLLSF